MSEESQPAFARLCLVTAVEVEFKIAISLLAARSALGAQERPIKICRGRAGLRQVTVLQTGMGALGFAEWFQAHLANNHYDAVIVLGLAGGLHPQAQTGAAIIYERCYDARRLFPPLTSKETSLARDEKASIACDDELSRFLLLQLQAAGLACQRGAGVTVGRILVAAADKHAMGAHHNAAAVDMETYDVLEVCAQRGLPAAALRIVSDEAELDLPNFNRVVGADGRMSGWRTAAVLLARPRVSLRFLRNIRPALRALRASLRALLAV